MLRFWGRALATRASSQRRHFSHPSESFLSGSSGSYLEAQFDAWVQDNNSVHKSWDAFFRNLNLPSGKAVTLPKELVAGVNDRYEASGAAPFVGVESDLGQAEDYMKLLLLSRSFQIRGHYLAQLDPLGLYRNNLNMDDDSERLYYKNFLSIEAFGFTEADLDRKFSVKSAFGGAQSGILSKTKNEPMALRHIVSALMQAYCGDIGIEFMHIADLKQQTWIRNKFELSRSELSVKDKKILLDRLTYADMFERFLAKKYSSAKRFGLEGAETVIPGMKSCIDKAVEMGATSCVIGMPHRGRLNVLANVMRKPMETIFHEFKGGGAKFDSEGSGDVKYHLGFSVDRPTYSGTVHLSLAANPSHLEAVNPIVEGNVRAKQFYNGDHHERKSVVSILLHGDAAFAGQGVVFETMELSDLHNYTTGGTIHIVVNNQVGFTTDPHSSRSSPYCSDVAKAIGAPIFHVNGDDAEAVNFVCTAAAEYRQTFGKSVVVDIVCYRRHGHNEIDEPAFTQPKLYSRIKAHPPSLEIYTKQLIEEGVLTKDEALSSVAGVEKKFEDAYVKARDPGFQPEAEKLNAHWRNFKSNADTFADFDSLHSVFKAISTYPENFNINPKLVPQLKAKQQMAQTQKGIDWATGEALAFGTLLLEGKHVRLSGQDVERGTFSQRHAVAIDQETETAHVFLNHIKPDQAFFHATNSSLSEYGVLGFELGYSMENPDSLVLWEAQFGDFVNGAQIIIDQFISSMEQKWGRQSGLVMLLPHGFEGQGPEHSSARFERFLQQSDDDPTKIPELVKNGNGEWSVANPLAELRDVNWVIANCSTPANYFHILRRQIHNGAGFRKPLILITPKSLLREKDCQSNLSEFLEPSTFSRAFSEVDPEVTKQPNEVKRLIFCTGKVYYDLLKKKSALKTAGKFENNVAISRIEQFTPFPYDHVINEANRYPNAEIVWVQEEPMNMGAWTYVNPRIETALEKFGGKRARYVGRKPAASPATGLHEQHVAELEAFTSKAFAL